MISARYMKPFDVFVALFFLFMTFAWHVNSARAADIGLIEPAMLKEQRDRWIVIDARPAARWSEGHIPGAYSFSWEDYTRTDHKGTRFRLRPARELAEALGSMGIDERSAIAVYGDADTSWGGEGWSAWVLEWLGHKGPVRLLAGGIASWKDAGYAITSDREVPRGGSARYQFSIRPTLDVTVEELKGAGASCSLIDTRSTLEWIQGRLPNAVHIPWTDFYTGRDRRPIGRDELVELLKKNGVGTDKPIVYYCTGGVRSGYTWLVHELAGLPAARNYVGGYEEWKKLSVK
jgi:thiosulfate/3-mercaptopyruvate sulfurtransferase